MKLSYLLVAVLGLSAIFAPNGFANSNKPVRGIDVVVLKEPGSASRTQHATVNADGSIMVKLAEPGDYTIKYAEGPLKGQVIKTVKAEKAESVKCKVDARYGGMQFGAPPPK